MLSYGMFIQNSAHILGKWHTGIKFACLQQVSKVGIYDNILYTEFLSSQNSVHSKFSVQ